MQVAGYCVEEAGLVLPGAAFISQPPEGRMCNWGWGGAHKAAGSERSLGKQESRPSIGEDSVDFSLFLSSNSEAVEIKDLLSCVWNVSSPDTIKWDARYSELPSVCIGKHVGTCMHTHTHKHSSWD